MTTANPDLQRWPIDVQDLMDYLSGPGWCMKIPKNKQRKSFYIQGLRQLKEAAGPKWPAVLAGLLEFAKDEYAKTEQLPPWFPPASPKSLVNMAARMRGVQEMAMEDLNRRRYAAGKYADAIQS